MLSNYVVDQQKIVLVHDKLGIGRYAHRIVSSWLTEQKGSDLRLKDVERLDDSYEAFLLLLIARLERHCEPQQLFRYVGRCKNHDTVQQLFAWIAEKQMDQSFLVPYLQHMAGLVITIEDEQHLSVLTKKTGGTVVNKCFQYQVRDRSFIVKEMKKSSKGKQMIASTETPINPASLGTFKIDLKQEEVEARNALTLPYEFYKSTPDGGKVLYHPDAADDLDEEDPDNDLLI